MNMKVMSKAERKMEKVKFGIGIPSSRCRVSHLQRIRSARRRSCIQLRRHNMSEQWQRTMANLVDLGREDRGSAALETDRGTRQDEF